MGGQTRTADEKIARIASLQTGVVTRGELLAAGISGRQIDRRIERGILIPEFRGVYRVGHSAPSVEAHYLAAVKACGEGAVLSGFAAAFWQGLIKGEPPPPEVTARTERRIRGITVRRSRRMHSLDTATYRGIPITTVPRTLLDVSASLSLSDLARACHEAWIRYRVTPTAAEAVLARNPNAPGAGKLRKVMLGEVRVTLSRLEDRFLALLEAESLPLPETNRVVGTKRVDCHWQQPPLTVELNSYRFHNSRHAWEQERVREREARKRGDEWRTFAYSDVFEDPTYILGELRQLLGASLPAEPRRGVRVA
jgi:hypothetical protein